MAKQRRYVVRREAQRRLVTVQRLVDPLQLHQRFGQGGMGRGVAWIERGYRAVARGRLFVPPAGMQDIAERAMKAGVPGCGADRFCDKIHGLCGLTRPVPRDARQMQRFGIGGVGFQQFAQYPLGPRRLASGHQPRCLGQIGTGPAIREIRAGHAVLSVRLHGGGYSI